MDRQRKRGRRGRGNSFGNVQNWSHISPTVPQKMNLVQSLTSFLILSSLIGIVYLMLDYQCYNCSTKNNISNVTKNIEEISRNLSLMNSHYYDLEMQISHFTQEFPKVEKQIESLAGFAKIVEPRILGWNPKTHSPLPNVDVFLKKPDESNVSAHSISNEL